jgi:hypothetical protein
LADPLPDVARVLHRTMAAAHRARDVTGPSSNGHRAPVVLSAEATQGSLL